MSGRKAKLQRKQQKTYRTSALTALFGQAVIDPTRLERILAMSNSQFDVFCESVAKQSALLRGSPLRRMHRG